MGASLRMMSWKAKLLIAFVVLVFIGIFYFFSESGAHTFKDKITEAYQEMPADERRTSEWANYFMKLAWWRGILGDETMARQMYLEFLGITKDAKGQTVFETGKLDGKYVSPDGKTGWGPLHPRAAEAFYEYLVSYEIVNSSQFTSEECKKYYKLLYTWHMRYSPEKKPHPEFNRYWQKITFLYAKARQPWPQDIDPKAPLAPKIQE